MAMTGASGIESTQHELVRNATAGGPGHGARIHPLLTGSRSALPRSLSDQAGPNVAVKVLPPPGMMRFINGVANPQFFNLGSA